MRVISLILPFALFLCSYLRGAEPVVQVDFDTCKNNEALDAFLREASPLYAATARIVEVHGGYRIEDKQGVKGGLWNGADRIIQLNPQLAGAHRASIIAYEMANAYHQPLFAENDMAVMAGEITTKTEFALRQELVEYDSLRLHREILVEIEKHLGKIPPEFFYCSGNPKPDSVENYQLPWLSAYLKHMKASGHTAHFYEWFERHAPKNRANQTYRSRESSPFVGRGLHLESQPNQRMHAESAVGPTNW
jgi:hypothetical protein